MLSLDRPIGVFDSGVGGLTVLKALRAQLPHQDFIYFADTARVPYGRKPREMVAEFARQITVFLLQEGVQAIVVACNTASSAALPELAEESPVPLWGVIEPGVEAARRASASRRVGVIGTRGTIASGAYQQRLEREGLTVWARACPMFVHLVEEGLAESDEAEVLARHYLADHPRIDTLILGCTHYPMLRGVIGRVLGPSVTLVGSDVVTAELVRGALHARGTLRENGHAGHVLHYVTGDPLAYRHTAAVIGGTEGEIVPLDVTRLASAAEAVS
ncbi:MAG TPA: glutamate racemase [Bryobacteraceae bacterium]|nr:glutamate racemase [Bryobacteraceae bacterium]